jgi:long-chain acyl-CoA synthetase
MSAAAAPQQIATGGPRPDRPGTLNQLFFEAVERHDRPNAMLAKIAGVYQPISHARLAERVRHIAFGLQELGVARGDHVALLAENRPEWAIADYACLTAGIPSVPIYPTLPADQVAFPLEDSSAVAIFVSTEVQAQKVAACRGRLPALRYVIGFGDTAWPGVDLTFAELEARGAAAETPERVVTYRADALRVAPHDVATIIYTSGTTGTPKGAMLTHDNIASNVRAVMHVLPMTGRDVSLSFLPLSHILERMFDFLMFACGVSIAYVESMDTIVQNMGEVRPTLVVSVPRVYEKIYSRVLDNALAGGALKKRVFFWARRVGEQWAAVVLGGGTPAPALALRYAVARRLVFSKLKARVGGRLRYFVSGGAPLASEINSFFFAAGLTILEGYGLTETSPVIAVNTPADFRIGTVGKPIAGVQVMIAADGEILARGPNVMLGYLGNPGETAKAIDPDGWFHTGDIGTLEDGFLRITDRKKDIIVTSGGKNIAPQPIENLAKANKYVSEAVMIGDRRNYPVMLVVPNFESLQAWAKRQNLLYTDRRSLLALSAVQAKMEREVRSTFAGLANYETPRKIALLEHDFSIERGELTPTLKVKRRVVDERYRSEIDALYNGKG